MGQILNQVTIDGAKAGEKAWKELLLGVSLLAAGPLPPRWQSADPRVDDPGFSPDLPSFAFCSSARVQDPMQSFLFVLFLTGYALACVLGTNTGVGAAAADETNMLLHWPGYLVLGLVAVLALAKWRIRLPHAPCELCLLAGCLVAAYVAGRGGFSPVYKARMDTSLVLASLVVFVLSASHFSGPSYRRAWFGLMAFLLLANFAVVLVHLSGRGSFFLLPGYDRPDVGRAGGLFISPNHLGVFANLTLFPVLGLCFFGGGKMRNRIVLFAFSLVAMFCVAASASRAAVVALGAGLLVLVLVGLILAASLHAGRFARMLVAGLTAAVGLVMFCWYLVARFTGERFGNFEAQAWTFGLDNSRKSYWWLAYEQFRTSPLFGTGSRTFDSYFREFRLLGVPGHLGEARFAHSEYLQLLGDYGLIGVVLVLFLLIVCLVHGLAFLRWFLRKRVPRKGGGGTFNLGLTVGALCGVVAVAVGAAFEFPFHVPAIAISAAMLLGILANPGFERFAYCPFRSAGLRVFVKIAVAASGCLLLYWGIRYLPAEYFFERSRFAEARNRPSLERINLLNRAKEYDPYNPLIFYHGGSARMEMLSERMAPPVLASIAEKAREDLARAVELDPRDIYSRSMYVECLDSLGLVEEAGRISRGSFGLAPHHFNVLIAHANHLLRQRRWDEAEIFYLSASSTPSRWESVEGVLQYLKRQRELEAETKAGKGGGG